MLKNDQTYFLNFAVSTPQAFSSMFGHFSILCMKALKYCSPIEKVNVRYILHLRFYFKRKFANCKPLIRCGYFPVICPEFTPLRKNVKYSLRKRRQTRPNSRILLHLNLIKTLKVIQNHY